MHIFDYSFLCPHCKSLAVKNVKANALLCIQIYYQLHKQIQRKYEWKSSRGKEGNAGLGLLSLVSQ